MTADDLLAGPRGRRLCLELAAMLDEEISAAVFELGYELDPGKGTSVLRIAMTSDEPGARSPEQLPATVEALSDRLTSLEIPGLDGTLLQAALEQTVLSAMYWQEPDGRDVLAARPEIRSALSPLAAALQACPDARWWTGYNRDTQWAVEWRSPEVPAEQDPARTLAEWGRGMRRAEEAWRTSGRGLNWSGDWWSVPAGLPGTVGRLPEALSLVEDSPGWQEATTIKVSTDGSVFEIRTGDDWRTLCRQYPLDVSASRRADWFRTTGRDGRWVIPDWEQVAKRWDAVHLTVMGYLRCAGRALPVDDAEASVLAGWDPGRTLWLTGAVTDAGGHRQDWHRGSVSGWLPAA